VAAHLGEIIGSFYRASTRTRVDPLQQIKRKAWAAMARSHYDSILAEDLAACRVGDGVQLAGTCVAVGAAEMGKAVRCRVRAPRRRLLG
jgi:hypothetical protein